MSDTIGRVTVPVPPDSGATFPLAPDFGCGMMRPWQVITHRFGDLATKATQRFQVGIGPRKFSFQKKSLNIRDRALLVEFFNAVQGSYKSFTYNAPNLDRGATTTAYKVIFDTQPLSIEDLANRCQVGINFIEIPDPSTAPSYGISSTCRRFPSGALQTELLSQVQRIIPLVHIKVREPGVPEIYLSDRRCTVGGQLYLPRLLDLGEPGSDAIITQDIDGTADECHFAFGNADRVMTALSNDTSLEHAEIDLCLYWINAGILWEGWSGEIIDFVSNGSPRFEVRGSDPLFQINQGYPKPTVSHSCWKTFNDGVHCRYATEGSGGDSTSCDYFFDTPNGCQSHGMDASFGGHPAQPQGVQVKDNTTGVLGFGRNVVTATSIISDTMWDKELPEIWCNDDGDPGKCFMASGIVAAARDEGDFFDVLVIVGRGPISLYTGMQVYKNADGYRYIIAPTADGFLPHGFKVDSQFVVTHDPQSGLREIAGADPAIPSTDYFSLTQGAFGGGSARPPVAAGTAFIELRYAKPSGFKPSAADTHQAQIPISKGMKGWVWDSAGNRSEVEGLTNPFWIFINTYLRARGFDAADSTTQLDSFVLSALNDGAGNGTAEIADLSVVPLVGTGMETQFRFQGTLATSKPYRDWATEILAVGLGGFVWEFGRIKPFIRENASAVSAFTLGNILFQSLSLSPIKATFEKLVIEYADRNYQFQTNEAGYYDKSHAASFGRKDAPLNVKQHSVGCATGSQGSRMATVRCREEIGGIDAKEWAAARNWYWKTTILALETEAGQVVSMTHPDAPGGYSVNDWPTPVWQSGISHVRIQRWRLLKDWSIEIEARTVTASMYDVESGPKPLDVVAKPLPALFFPQPLGHWAPFEVQASASDALYPNEWTFELTQSYSVEADSILATLTAKGKLPVNTFISGCGAPLITAGSISESDVGGSLTGGKTFRVSVCARQADGKFSPPSAVIIVQVPTGTDTNSFTINGIVWPDFAGLTEYVVFVSDVDDLICRQQTGALVNTGSNVYTPDSITVTGPLERSTLALPNPNVALVRLKAKHGVHFGVLGLPVDSISGNRDIIAGQAVDVAGIDDWTGRKLIFTGRDQARSPFATYSVTAFDAATGKFTVDRDLDGIQAGDVFEVCTKGVDNSANPYEITDPGLSNAANYDLASRASTPHSGLKPDLEIGSLIRVIFGKGRGLPPVKVVGNGPIGYTLDRKLEIDATTIWIVESGTWEYEVDSSPIENADLLKPTAIAMPTDNFLKKSLLVMAFTVDSRGNEIGDDGNAPFQMIYVFGAGLQVIYVNQDTELGAYDQQVNVDTSNGPVNLLLAPSALMKGRRILSKIVAGDAPVSLVARTVNGVQETIDFDKELTFSGKGGHLELAGNAEIGTPTKPNFIALSSSGAIGSGFTLEPFTEVPVQQDMDGYVWALRYTPFKGLVWPILNNADLHKFFPTGNPQFTVDGNIVTLNADTPVDLAADWFEVWYFRKVANGTGIGKARQFGAGPLGGPGTGVALGRRIDWLEGRVQFNLISPPAPTTTVTIGTQTYVFVAALNPILDAVPNVIVTGPGVIWNFNAAINADPALAGIGYSSATVANPDVVASGFGVLQARPGSTLDVIDLISGAGGSILFSLPSNFTSFAETNHLTSGIMHDGDTVTVEGLTYTFKDAINNANPREILNSTSGDPGKDLDTPIRRLVDAINGGFGSGTRYSSATTANPDVTASYDPDSENLALISKTGGAVSVSLSESTGGRFFWASPTLTGGSGGTSDKIDWGHHTALNLHGDMSFGIWLKFPDNAFGTIVARNGLGVTGVGDNSPYALAVDGSSGAWDILYQHDAGSGSAAAASNVFPTAIPNGSWRFVAFTRDATAKTVELYVSDGVTIELIDTYTYTTQPDGGTDSDCNLKIGQGAADISGSWGPLVATVKEHYLWGRKSTQDELLAAAKGNPSRTGMLLGCDVGDDPEVDFSATGAEGTVTGTTLVQGHN